MGETTIVGTIREALAELGTIPDTCLGPDERAKCALCRAKAGLEEAIDMLDGSIVLS